MASNPSRPVTKPAANPVLDALEKAALDDEPYTDDERAKVAEARKAPRKDDATSDDVRRLLGL